MSIDVIKPKRKLYVRAINKQAEEDLHTLLSFLEDRGLAFYELKERSMGEQRYVDVMISIKLA